ncbi:MAG: CPBP family intramembrane glutamic endopeptidase [Candidatus Aquicultor sp.]
MDDKLVDDEYPEEQRAPDDQRVPWTIGDAILALVLFLVMVTLGTVVISGVLARELPKVGQILALFIGYIILFLLIGFFALRRGANLRTLGFRPFNFLRGTGMVVVWFFLIKLATVIYTLFAQRLGINPSEEAVRRLPEIFGRSTGGFLLAVLVVAIIAPVAEELFFRGFVYPAFRQRWGVTAAIIITSALFALYHISPTVYIPIFIIAVGLAYLYQTTDSLGPPIMLHALNNFLSVVVIYYSNL